MMASGYILGAADALTLEGWAYSNGKEVPCLPKSVTGQQINDTVEKFINNNLSKRNAPASEMVYTAQKNPFGCITK